MFFPSRETTPSVQSAQYLGQSRAGKLKAVEVKLANCDSSLSGAWRGAAAGGGVVSRRTGEAHSIYIASSLTQVRGRQPRVAVSLQISESVYIAGLAVPRGAKACAEAWISHTSNVSQPSL